MSIAMLLEYYLPSHCYYTKLNSFLNGIKYSGKAIIANIFPEHEGLLNQLPRIPINQKRDNGKIDYLKLWLNGVLPCCVNKLKRVV